MLNIIGKMLPLLVAIISTPKIIDYYGDSNFGLLALYWGVLGYFGICDFGVGKATNKIFSEAIQTGEQRTQKVIFNSMIVVLIIISFVVIGVCYIIIYCAVNADLKVGEISIRMINDQLNILVLIVPIIVLSNGIIAILEAKSKFGYTNLIIAPSNAIVFVAPLISLHWPDQLFGALLIIVSVKIIALVILYTIAKGTLVKEMNGPFVKLDCIKNILRIGKWVSVSNVVSPLMYFLDRYIIGVFISPIAVAYYTAPFTIISRILIIPLGFARVVFPFFARYSVTNQNKSIDAVKKLYQTNFGILLVFALIVLVFGENILSVWLNEEYAIQGTIPFKILSVGVLFNGLAYIPFNYLQANGKAKKTAIMHLIELPTYVILLFHMVSLYGIDGAAFTWSFRSFIDSILMHMMCLITIRSDAKITDHG